MDIFASCDFTKLRVLNLSNCNLAFYPKILNTLDNLVYLLLENNNIESIGEIKNKNLIVLSLFNNKLQNFPIIKSPLQCLNIANNKMTDISYKEINDIESLFVFIYFNNMFDNGQNKKLIWLEYQRQIRLVENYYDYDNNFYFCIFSFVIQRLEEKIQNKRVNLSLLKGIEEDLYESYYFCEFLDIMEIEQYFL